MKGGTGVERTIARLEIDLRGVDQRVVGDVIKWLKVKRKEVKMQKGTIGTYTARMNIVLEDDSEKPQAAEQVP